MVAEWQSNSLLLFPSTLTVISFFESMILVMGNFLGLQEFLQVYTVVGRRVFFAHCDLALIPCHHNMIFVFVPIVETNGLKINQLNYIFWRYIFESFLFA
jgi:hypothetical protein